MAMISMAKETISYLLLWLANLKQNGYSHGKCISMHGGISFGWFRLFIQRMGLSHPLH